MATPIIMPRQGQSVESCIISNWAKKVGDKVAEGDTLFTYETDKATFDEEAKISGTLLAIFFNEGDDVPCLTNVCVIGNPGESFAEFDPNGGAQAVAPAAPAAPAAAGWKCSCGATATGNFCPECGAKKPDDEGWKCSCGAVLRHTMAWSSVFVSLPAE